MGQGRPGCQHQAGVTRHTFHNLSICECDRVNVSYGSKSASALAWRPGLPTVRCTPISGPTWPRHRILRLWAITGDRAPRQARRTRFPRDPNVDRLCRKSGIGGSRVRRREFIAGLGSAATWPLAARAQLVERVRRIGVLTTRDETDPVTKLQVSVLTQALADLGWTVGRNVGWTFVGPAMTSIGYERSRRSWSACNRTSSWHSRPR